MWNTLHKKTILPLHSNTAMYVLHCDRAMYYNLYYTVLNWTALRMRKTILQISSLQHCYVMYVYTKLRPTTIRTTLQCTRLYSAMQGTALFVPAAITDKEILHCNALGYTLNSDTELEPSSAWYGSVGTGYCEVLNQVLGTERCWALFSKPHGLKLSNFLVGDP